MNEIILLNSKINNVYGVFFMISSEMTITKLTFSEVNFKNTTFIASLYSSLKMQNIEIRSIKIFFKH